MVGLEELDLSKNELTHFQPQEIGNIENLKILNISHNKLEELPRGDIFNLTYLTYVDASYNRIQTFDDTILPRIENGTLINLEGNPIACDCRMRPLKKWLDLENSYGIWSQLQCYAPQTFRGKHLKELSQEDLSCSLSTSGIVGQQYDLLPDLEFIDITSSSTRIIFSWVVSTRKDISDFRAIIFPSQGARTQSNDLSSAIPIFDYRLDPIVEKDIGYGIRTSFIDGLESENYYVLCIIGRRSSGELTLLKRKQCRTNLLAMTRFLLYEPDEVPVVVEESSAMLTRKVNELYFKFDNYVLSKRKPLPSLSQASKQSSKPSFAVILKFQPKELNDPNDSNNLCGDSKSTITELRLLKDI
ncbi:hypothetical protein QYM36_007573 [Artemia franciscana]|uniref:LRRCT domain-containing protein n=1 Tax=Artemia franciscana TaxID=6661 RepID=A0AA88ICM5_ARTSF|nr:hypothetical protein QYM36_007573 [Artemia franciscana]